MVDDMSIGKKKISPPEYLQGVAPKFSTFTQAQLASKGLSGQNISYMVSGRDLKENDSMAVILDENSVISMGVTDYKSLIGKKIKLHISGKKYEIEIVGIYSKSLSMNGIGEVGTVMYDEEKRISACMESAFFSKDVITEINQDNKRSTDISQILVSSYNIEGILELYNKLSNSIKNEIYCDAELMSSFQLYIKFFTSSFAVIGIVLFFLALYDLYGIMRIVLEKRKKWFGVQRILGFTRRQITECYIMELATVEILGVTIGLLVMFVLNNIMNQLAKQYYNDLMGNTHNIFVIPIVFLQWIVISSIVFIFIMGLLSEKEIKKANMDYIKGEIL